MFCFPTQGEKQYNPFYAELCALLCSQNRQYRTTLQFTFWDCFKVLGDIDASEARVAAKATRRSINMARMLAYLVSKFHLPIAVLKPIDISEASSFMVLFLATFFLALFSEQIEDEVFQTCIDRLAASADFSSVRDGILIFLNTHLKHLPEGMSSVDAKRVMKRRKMTVKTMEAMSILDMVREPEESDNWDDPMGRARLDGQDE